MQNIDSVLNANRFAVDGLFRQYKVNGTSDMDKIRDGYHNHGAGRFMVKLMAAITPKGPVSGYDPTALESLLPAPYVAPLVLPATTEATAVTPTAKGWTVWNNFLNALGNTASTIGGAISAVKGPLTATDPAVVQQERLLAASDAKTTNMLYIGAALFVAVIIIILISKK